MKEAQPSDCVDKEGFLEAEGNVGCRKQRRVSSVPSQQVVQAGVQFLHDQDGKAGGRKETYPKKLHEVGMTQVRHQLALVHELGDVTLLQDGVVDHLSRTHQSVYLHLLHGSVAARPQLPTRGADVREEETAKALVALEESLQVQLSSSHVVKLIRQHKQFRYLGVVWVSGFTCIARRRNVGRGSSCQTACRIASGWG